MPYISTAGELKTKPTQSSVKVLRSMGIQPDVIVCRTEVPMSTDAKDKIALFCNVKAANVIQNLDVDCLYDIPLMLEKEGMARAVLNELGLENRPAELDEWKAMVKHRRELTDKVNVALVGKYVSVPDAYLSVAEALRHAGLSQDMLISLRMVDSARLTPDAVAEQLKDADAIVLPGGYGSRGAEGIILAAQYARENRIPLLAIGYGMQLVVVEAVRNLLGKEGANSAEVDPMAPDPVIRIPEDRVCRNDSRGATRMGGSDIRLSDGAIERLYGNSLIHERHSNRYEVDQQFVAPLAQKGLRMVGVNIETGYPEAFELDGHPYYAAVIYHPEYVSRPGHPHPLFTALIQAAKRSR
jgi:CTP synthase